jgi:assimilatory nitrate reductase catalytic subunit
MWPVRAEDTSGDTRFFANGGFFTVDRKARFIAPEKPAPRMAVTANFPFRLNTGRVRDQWHTMTRTGLSPRLGIHIPEPFVEVHLDDLEKAGLTDGGFARITTPYGSCLLKVTVSPGQRPGSLFVPIHWSAETASSARVGELVNPHTDPFSGQPEAKATPAAIVAVDFAYRGFALSRTPMALPSPTWWARVTVTGGTGYLLATNDAPERWQERARALFPDCELAEYMDGPRGLYRIAAFRDGRLEGCLFVGPAAHAPQWDSVKTLFEMEAIEHMQRRMLLSGKVADGIAEIGPVICACFGVGLNTIREALASGTVTNVETIGQALRAGTNCGSCLPELKRIVHDRAPQPV